MHVDASKLFQADLILPNNHKKRAKSYLSVEEGKSWYICAYMVDP